MSLFRRSEKPAAAFIACVIYASLGMAQPVANDAGFFVDRLLPIFENAQCRLCHNDNGIASRSGLRFPDADAGRDRLIAFGLSLRTFIDADDPAKSRLVLKPTQRIEHTGGERISPDSPAEETLLAWVNYLRTQSDQDNQAATGSSPTVRSVGSRTASTTTPFTRSWATKLGPLTSFPRKTTSTATAIRSRGRVSRRS